MTVSDTPNSAADQKRAEQLDIAHTAAAQDTDWVMTRCDIRGRLIPRHDPRPEQRDPFSDNGATCATTDSKE
jgi:hypothetical protein